MGWDARRARGHRAQISTHQHQQLADPGSWTACPEFEVSNVMFLSGTDSNGCVSCLGSDGHFPSAAHGACCCRAAAARGMAPQRAATLIPHLLLWPSSRFPPAAREHKIQLRAHTSAAFSGTHAPIHTLRSTRRLARCSVQHSRTYFVRLTATRLMWPRGIVRRAGAGRPNIMSPPECRGKESRVAGTAAVHATQHVRIAGFPLVAAPELSWLCCVQTRS